MSLPFVVTLRLVRGYNFGSTHSMQDIPSVLWQPRGIPAYTAHRRLQYEYLVK